MSAFWQKKSYVGIHSLKNAVVWQGHHCLKLPIYLLHVFLEILLGPTIATVCNKRLGSLRVSMWYSYVICKSITWLLSHMNAGNKFKKKKTYQSILFHDIITFILIIEQYYHKILGNESISNDMCKNAAWLSWIILVKLLNWQ